MYTYIYIHQTTLNLKICYIYIYIAMCIYIYMLYMYIYEGKCFFITAATNIYVYKCIYIYKWKQAQEAQQSNHIIFLNTWSISGMGTWPKTRSCPFLSSFWLLCHLCLLHLRPPSPHKTASLV